MTKIQLPTSRELDIIAIGRIGIDLNPSVFNMPMEKVETYNVSVGGSPANIAVGAARLGLNVGFIGRVAENGMGDYCLNYFKEQGIDTSQIKKDNSGMNGVAFTEVASSRNCKAVIYRDNVVDLNFAPQDVSEEYIKKAKMLLISGTALSRSPSREATLVAVNYAKKHGVLVSVDLDFRDYTWESYEAASLYYNLLCNDCDIIIGTREEFDVLEYLWDKGNESNEKSAKCWLDKNTQVVIIKEGKDGSMAFCKNGEVISVKPMPAVVKKTFGAGDAYASSFLSSLICGDDVETAMINGSASASIVISKEDCTKAMPTQKEREEYINLVEAGKIKENI